MAAKELSFVNVTDYQEAKQQNIADPKEWEAYKAKAAVEAEKQAKEQASEKEEKKRIEAEKKAEQERKDAAAKETIAQQNPAQQAAQANAQPKPDKINPKLDPSKNIKLILDTLNAKNRPWQSNWHTICTNSNFCSLNVGDFRIEAVGGTVNIRKLKDAINTADYMHTCSTILSALGGINQTQANEYTVNAFHKASQSGNEKYKISSVEFTIRKGSDLYLVCNFFHATNAAMLSPDASDEAKGQPEETILPDDGKEVPMHDLDWSDLDKK